MIKNSQLQEFLKGYADDAEVIIIDTGDKHEIKHVGMAHDKTTNKYKVVLAQEVPTHCCNICGENVYRVRPTSLTDYFYCPTCDVHKSIVQVTKL